MLTGAKRQAFVIRLGAFIVLAAAVLPNATYFGHWNAEPPAHSHAGQAQNDPHDHATHCHGVGTSNCSNAHSLVGVAGFDGLLLAKSDLQRTDLISTEKAAAEAPASRILHPPQGL